VGDPASIPFLTTLLRDDDALVREHGARGLATACQSGNEQPLVAALAHADLAVRSWAADGLSKLGDVAGACRCWPERSATSICRSGAARCTASSRSAATACKACCKGWKISERDLQELTFAVIVARDIALARAKLEPDLLLSALSAGQPEIRYAAARVLEARLQDEDLGQWGLELIGPRQPEKASDMRNWPEAGATAAPAKRRGQRPGQRCPGPALRRRPGSRPAPATGNLLARGETLGRSRHRPAPPQTAPETETRLERKTGWIRGLFAAQATTAETGLRHPTPVDRVALRRWRASTAQRARSGQRVRTVAARVRHYAGLIRQAPIAKGPDDYQRVRRDSIARLAALAQQTAIGREAVLPVLRQALGDPHHLVRQAALNALAELHPNRTAGAAGAGLATWIPPILAAMPSTGC
jgi:ParB family chromosome partitioning protein